MLKYVSETTIPHLNYYAPKQLSNIMQAKLLESITVQMEGLSEQERKALTDGDEVDGIALTEMQHEAHEAAANLVSPTTADS